ncbi:MAG: patatin-like phospholipase family protein [Myxococcota bacterium]
MTRDGRGDHRTALILGGGGITGAMYGVGCLAALEEAFEGFSASDFDFYAGVSSGATVAVALAAGFPAQRLYRALLDPADDFFPLQRQHLLRFDSFELKRMVSSVGGALRRSITAAASKPLSLDLWTEIDRFYDSLPAGLFTVDAYERFLTDFMTRRGIPKRFDRLRRPLAIVAQDLDAGSRAVFGTGALGNVPVARAVAAASAVPILFAPVRVGGRDYVAADGPDAALLELCTRHGCDAALVVNPLVPVRADGGERRVPTGHGPRRRVRDKGLLWVHDQSVRMSAESRLTAALQVFRQGHADMSVALLEPDRDEATMFMYSPMNFAARRVILEDAYTTTLLRLREGDSTLWRTLVERGLRWKGS